MMFLRRPFSKLIPMVLGVVLWSTTGVPKACAAPSAAQTWKAGVGRTVITPEQPLWMAGYASRNHPAVGTLHALWVKALALEDADGHRAVLVTTDLLGLPKGISDHVRARLEEAYHLQRDQVMLTSSHTHSGPVLQNALSDIYPLGEERKAKIDHYSRVLERRIVATVGEALGNLAPAQLFAGMGIARFAVNRRNNDAAEVTSVTDRALEGPTLNSVPVLKVERPGGQLLAVAFGYACHNTVLSGYKWSGDYAGFAQLALEKRHPGATALFFAGAGADQNPLPRRSVALAWQYGQELAVAVERVLKEPMRTLAPQLTTSYSEIDLALTEPPTREELRAIAEERSGFHRRWALRLLRKLDRDAPLRREYPYPIQAWQLGEQTLVALGGEVVVDYAFRLKRLFGEDLFVIAYANDVMAYIPSARVLREGGYEAVTSQRVYGLPSTWAASIEGRIIQEVRRLITEELGIPLPQQKQSEP